MSARDPRAQVTTCCLPGLHISRRLESRTEQELEAGWVFVFTAVPQDRSRQGSFRWLFAKVMYKIRWPYWLGLREGRWMTWGSRGIMPQRTERRERMAAPNWAFTTSAELKFMR